VEAVVYKVWGDESHDGKADVVYVVSGLFGDDGDWNNTEASWLEVTNGGDFHASEWSSRPEYNRLCRVIRDSKLILFAAGMELRDYESIFPSPVEQLPYYFCFTKVIEHMVDIASQCLTRDTVKFTFDRNLEVKYNAEYLYDCMIKLPEFEHSELLEDRISFSSKKDPRIQMADMVARETMNWLAVCTRRTNQARSICIAELLDRKRLHWHHFEKSYFEQRVAHMQRLAAEGHPMGSYEEWRKARNCQDTTENRTRFHVEIDRKLRAKGL
jgi:hypothetical protein